METSNDALVDLFWGNDAVDLPPPRDIAATWNWLKAIAGNTHPGATLPLGMVSALPFSGCYPSGYGMNEPNWEDVVPKRFDRKTATGITHFHQTGTGEIGKFYNYLRTSPTTGNAVDRDERHDLVNEQAMPGYYAAELAPVGIRFELSTTRRCALHRYHFPQGSKTQLNIQLARGGLGDEYRATYASAIQVSLDATGGGSGCIVMAGLPIYFAFAPSHASAACFWINGDSVDARSLQLPAASQTVCPKDAGITITGDPEAAPVMELRIAFSLRSAAQATQTLQSEGAITLEAAREAATAAWQEIFDRVSIETVDPTLRKVFYSAIYQSFVKPTDHTGESPFAEGDAPCYFDYATLWDQYKTHVPLIMMLRPRTASRMINAWLDVLKTAGYPPNMLLLQALPEEHYDQQASHLIYHTMGDACFRRLDDIDWDSALKTLERSFFCKNGSRFAKEGTAEQNTHVLDLSVAAATLAAIARQQGRNDLADRLAPVAAHWRNAFSTETGILIENSHYYEGTFWTYSFRLMPDMAARIQVAGGDAAFVELLDTYFGYADLADGSVDPSPGAGFTRTARHHRFEGLNNEPDMETPYAYVFAGRHDRTCEIVRAVMRYQFGPGDGGLPGNNDSGALSSWFVWNAAGLFPVTGQDLYLIGSPALDTATFHLDGGDFTIRARDNSDENIYVTGATLNGTPIKRAWLRIAEVETGGELILSMGPEPNGWASEERPPALGG